MRGSSENVHLQCDIFHSHVHDAFDLDVHVQNLSAEIAAVVRILYQHLSSVAVHVFKSSAKHPVVHFPTVVVDLNLYCYYE